MSRSSSGHTGGYTEPAHGTIGANRDVTVSFGKGTSSGETLLRDGHVDQATFWGTEGKEGHDHYGAGNGPHNNGTDRHQYNGTGSGTDKGSDSLRLYLGGGDYM